MQKYEDYLEEMYELHSNNQKITSKELVKKLKVSRSSVSQMLRKLKKEGFIDFVPYGDIKILKKGIEKGQAIAEIHEALEELFEKLSIKKNIALNDIHGLEHHLSPETLNAIRRLNKHLDNYPLDNNTN